jgi:CheY-like chemotaxis protein
MEGLRSLIGTHVIVCSTDPAVGDAVSQAFRGGDLHRQTVCESGLEVLGAVGVLDSDLLVLDLESPGLSGLLLISAIRELAPTLPILAVSTHEGGVDVRALAEKGVPYVRIDPGGISTASALRSEVAHLRAARGAPVKCA